MKRGALKEGVCRLEAGRATTSRSAGPVGIGGVGEMCRWQQEKRRTYLDDPSQHKTASHLQTMADGSSNAASAAAEGDSIGTRPGEAAEGRGRARDSCWTPWFRRTCSSFGQRPRPFRYFFGLSGARQWERSSSIFAGQRAGMRRNAVRQR